MKNGVIGVLVAAGLVVATGAGYWLGHRSPANANAAPAAATPASAQGKDPGAGAPVTIEAAKVAVASLPQSITAVGSLRSDESVTLRPEVAGRISQIAFTEGQRVTKGVLLVRLDPAINEAEVQQARANQTLAKSKFDRAVDLSKSNFISGQARDEAENNLKVADAALQLAQAKLAKTQILAPFSGIIGLRQVSIGDYVKEGADLVNLEAIDPLKVDFRVPELYMTQVKVGQTLQVSLDALPGKTYEGRVFAINPLVDAAGRAIVIRAQVRNADTSLRPGMFARVRLITEQRRDSLVVPEQALVPQGTEQYVYRVVEGRAQRVKVDIGQRRDAKVEITQGLAAEDVVVTAGQLKLRDGAPVAIAGAGAPRAVAGAPVKNESPPPVAPKS
jgi:membrane fusion protein, multidrug efflux system